MGIWWYTLIALLTGCAWVIYNYTKGNFRGGTLPPEPIDTVKYELNKDGPKNPNEPKNHPTQ